MKAKLESLESFCFPSRRLEAGLLFSSLSLFSLSLFHFFHSKKKKRESSLSFASERFCFAFASLASALPCPSLQWSKESTEKAWSRSRSEGEGSHLLFIQNYFHAVHPWPAVSVVWRVFTFFCFRETRCIP